MNNITLNDITEEQVEAAAKMSNQKVENVCEDIFGCNYWDCFKADPATTEACESTFQEFMDYNDGDVERALSCLIDYRARTMPEYYA
jgi:hypothetical protein